MNDTLQAKKEGLIEALSVIENETIITRLFAMLQGCIKAEEKKLTEKEEREEKENTENSKIKQAAYTLDGELYEIERNLNKILFLLQEMEDNYYYELDVWKEEDRKKIINEYVKNSTYTQIIQDNAIAIERVLNGIKKASDTVKTA